MNKSCVNLKIKFNKLKITWRSCKVAKQDATQWISKPKV